MHLIRSISTNADIAKYDALDDLIWILNFCTVCHELMLEIYRSNTIVEKYCKACRTFVEILEAEIPLVDFYTRDCVDITQMQVINFKLIDCH